VFEGNQMDSTKEGRIRIFPEQVDNNFRGCRIAATVFLLIALFTLMSRILAAM
jgi:hypothetical protein